MQLWDKAVEVEEEEEKPAVLLGELAESSITKYHSLADGAPLHRLLMVHRTASLMGAARASWAVPMSSDGCLKPYGDDQVEATFSDEENDKDSDSDGDEGMGRHDGHDWHISTSAESEQRCMEEDGDDDDDDVEEEEGEEATLHQAGSTCPALVERSKRRKRKRRNAGMMERPIRLKISPQIAAAVNAASEADADA